MMKIALSPAAAGLLRQFLSRSGVDRHRILLTEIRSTDWRSLTFAGERHEMELRVTGPDADELVERMTNGLADLEFTIPGQIVADIGLKEAPSRNADGSICLLIEALTIAE